VGIEVGDGRIDDTAHGGLERAVDDRRVDDAPQGDSLMASSGRRSADSI